MNILYDEGKFVAEYFDVQTNKDSLVVYSVSFLPTKENKYNAFKHVEEYPYKKMLDHTPCGQKLNELDLFSKPNEMSRDEAYQIWFIASKRLIESASGNVTAFIDKAHKDSTFRRIELPAILANKKITTINFQNKWDYEELVTDNKDWYQTSERTTEF